MEQCSSQSWRVMGGTWHWETLMLWIMMMMMMMMNHEPYGVVRASCCALRYVSWVESWILIDGRFLGAMDDVK